MKYWLYRVVFSAVIICAIVVLHRLLGSADEVTLILYLGLIFGLLLALILEGSIAIVNVFLTKTRPPLKERDLSDEELPDYLGILIQYFIFSKEIQRNPSIKTNQRNFITFFLILSGVYYAVSILLIGIKDDELKLGILLSFCWILSYGGAVFLSRKIDERIRRYSLK